MRELEVHELGHVSGSSNLIELGSILQQIVAIGGITGGVVYLRGSEDPTLAGLSGSILGGMAGTVVGYGYSCLS